jgi:hypothetical protein
MGNPDVMDYPRLFCEGSEDGTSVEGSGVSLKMHRNGIAILVTVARILVLRRYDNVIYA